MIIIIMVGISIILAIRESRAEELRKSAEFFRRLDAVAIKRILESRVEHDYEEQDF